MKINRRVLIFFVFVCSAQSQWFKQSFPSNEYLWKVRFATSSTGWVAGANHLFKTTNGGGTWVKQDTLTAATQALYVSDTLLAFCSTYNGVSVSTAKIRRTVNGGQTWEVVDSSGFVATEFAFTSPEVGFAVGFKPLSSDRCLSVIKKTTDKGLTWSSMFSDTASFVRSLEGVSFANQSLGWAVTYDGHVYHTSDAGTSWSVQDSLRPSPGVWHPVRDVEFTTIDSGWAVGGLTGTMILARTTNGGVSWSVATAAGSSLREVKFINSHLGWFAGGIVTVPPYIARTTNSGVVWETQQVIPSSDVGFESLTIVNENLGWAVGGSGIYKTTNGGVTWGSNEVIHAVSFSLEQNYPNPFNPVTVISFQLSAVSFVTLKVYDILGREVAVLVNGEKEAGRHIIEWNAGEFPSGVYFYRLNAWSSSRHSVETRKMVLAK